MWSFKTNVCTITPTKGVFYAQYKTQMLLCSADQKTGMRLVGFGVDGYMIMG